MIAQVLIFPAPRRGSSNALLREIQWLSTFEYRANTLYRLWERPRDDPTVLKLQARLARRDELIRLHGRVA